MGLQWFAGFEAGDRNELVSYSGGVSVQSGYARSGQYGCRIMVPPSSVGFIMVANGFDSTGRPALAANVEVRDVPGTTAKLTIPADSMVMLGPSYGQSVHLRADAGTVIELAVT